MNQALDVMRELKTVIPIERAKMRLRVEVTQNDNKKVKQKLSEFIPDLVSEDCGGMFAMVNET